MSDIQRQLADLVKAFNAKGKEIETSLDVAMNAASMFVRDKAKSDGYVPVLFGLLRNSITNRVRKINGRVTGEIGTSVEYAPFQEFGTVKMPAANGGRGFLRVALDDSKNTVQAIITAYLKKVL